jgi:4-alpha-glucanotransferase
MAETDAEKLDTIIEKYDGKMPRPIGRFVHWLRKPESRWIRLVAGVLFVILGCVGFLPVLGFWMVPLGFILLAQDIPILRRPTLAAITWVDKKVTDWRNRRS